VDYRSPRAAVGRSRVHAGVADEILDAGFPRATQRWARLVVFGHSARRLRDAEKKESERNTEKRKERKKKQRKKKKEGKRTKKKRKRKKEHLVTAAGPWISEVLFGPPK